MAAEKEFYRFQKDIPDLVVSEISRLEGFGYYIHKEWENGIEMRKKTSVGTFGIFMRSMCALFFPIIGLPFFGRTLLDAIYGYKTRIFVLCDPQSPEVYFL